MNLASSTAALRAAQAAYAERPQSPKATAGVELLKKSLQADRDAAETLLKTLEPKGRILDVRV